MALSNPVTTARAIRGEKGGAGIEAAPLYLVRLLRPPPSRALPKIRIPLNPQAANKLVRLKDLLRTITRSLTDKETHSTKN